MTDATDLLKPGERLDYLARENLSIIQNPDYFAFSVDAILLAHFAKVPRRQTARILDLCSGTGVIPFLLSAKTAGHIDAIELHLQKLCPIFGGQFIRRYNSVSFVPYFICFHTIRGTYCMMLSHYLRRTKNNAIAPITGAMARVINAD